MPSHDITIRVVVNLLLVALGYTLKRLDIISRQDGRVLNRLVLYVTLPATSLHAIAGADITWQLLLLPLVFFVVPIGLCLAGTLPARSLDLSRPAQGTFLVSLCGFMASLAYPFADAAYGMPGVQALAVCDLGNALAIFGVGY
jgi:predicted permease